MCSQRPAKYTFRIHPDAHKTQVRQAVEALFDVHVQEVRTISVKSKRSVAASRAVARAREEGDRPGPRRARPIPIFATLESTAS